MSLLEEERVRQERGQIWLRVGYCWLAAAYIWFSHATAVAWLSPQLLVAFILSHHVWPLCQWHDMRTHPIRHGRREFFSIIDVFYVCVVLALDPWPSLPILYFLVAIVLANGFRYGLTFFRFIISYGLVGYIAAMSFRIYEGFFITGVEFGMLAVCFCTIFVYAYALVAKLENINMQTEKQSMLDPLTGLHNRRAYDRLLARAAGNATQDAQTSLILVDIDGFKQINDDLGHAHGDAALVQLATILHQCVRPTDHVCRLGGDEFAIIMEGSDLQVADTAATRIQQMLADGKTTGFTVSIGIAAIPDHGGNQQELVQQADRALYLSKKEGKNRATRADFLVPELGHRTRS